MVIYYLIFLECNLIDLKFSIEREEQERLEKEAKDRKAKEDASNGNLFIDIF